MVSFKLVSSGAEHLKSQQSDCIVGKAGPQVDASSKKRTAKSVLLNSAADFLVYVTVLRCIQELFVDGIHLANTG